MYYKYANIFSWLIFFTRIITPLPNIYNSRKSLTVTWTAESAFIDEILLRNWVSGKLV